MCIEWSSASKLYVITKNSILVLVCFLTCVNTVWKDGSFWVFACHTMWINEVIKRAPHTTISPGFMTVWPQVIMVVIWPSFLFITTRCYFVIWKHNMKTENALYCDKTRSNPSIWLDLLWNTRGLLIWNNWYRKWRFLVDWSYAIGWTMV